MPPVEFADCMRSSIHFTFNCGVENRGDRINLVDKLNDLLWAVGFMLAGVLGMVLNYGDSMFLYGVLVFIGGAIWVLLIRIRKSSSDHSS